MDSTATVGRAELYASDICEFLEEYQGRQFDVTVTSPPYNLDKEYEGVEDAWAYDDYLAWVERWSALLLEATTDRGRLCLNIPTNTFRGGHLPLAADVTKTLQDAGWSYQTEIVWYKQAVSNRTAYGSFKDPSAPNIIMPTEQILIFSNGDWIRGKHGRTTDLERDQFLTWTRDIWTIQGAKAKKIGHPAPFPNEIARRLLLLFAYKEDLIFDPFVGSGTTCLAAEQLGMQSVGVDLSDAYITLSEKRLREQADTLAGALTDANGVRWENLSLEAAS